MADDQQQPWSKFSPSAPHSGSATAKPSLLDGLLPLREGHVLQGPGRPVPHAGAGFEAQDYTRVAYLALPQPRTSHLEAALESVVPGHGHELSPSRLASPEEREAFIKEQLAKVEPIEGTVHSIDWWCGKISEEGVGLRMDKSLTMRRTVSAGRERAARCEGW